MSSIYILACRHALARESVARVGDELYCWKCRDARPIVEVRGEYRNSCQHCRYARRFGAAGQASYSAARKHCATHPGHVVVVKLGHRVVHRVRSPELPAKDWEQLRLDE